MLYKDVLELYKSKEMYTHSKSFDILHLHSTGERCIEDNSGFHDSQHFRLTAFNSLTRERWNLGIHDGITSYEGMNVKEIRIYEDGSTFIKFKDLCTVEMLSQQIVLTSKIN